MLKKLNELEVQPDNNYNTINDDNKEAIKRMIGYDLTPEASDDSLQEIKYYILKKQLKKVLQKKREEIFKSGMKDPCHGLGDKCSTNPMCYHKPYDLKFTSNGTVYNAEIYDKCKDGRVIYKFPKESQPNSYDIYSIRKKNGNNFYLYQESDPLDKEAFCNLDYNTNELRMTDIPNTSFKQDNRDQYTLETQCQSSLSSILSKIMSS